MSQLCRVRRAACLVLAGVLFTHGFADGQDSPSGDEPLTKEEFARFLVEYRQFRADYENLKSENAQLKAALEEVKAQIPALSERTEKTERALAYAKAQSALLEEMGRTESILPGLTNFTLGGFASARFDNRDDEDSTFGANVSPIVLWKPTDELLFESRFDIFLAERETEVDLAYAHLSYLLNDYVTVGGGKFVMPFGIFWERARAPWINKLPTMPLLYERNFIGEAGVGVQVRGGIPIGPTKLNYAAYVINGPEFRTNPSDLGRLGFGRGRDNNNNKAVGGRVGFLPIPELEIGASLLAGRTGNSGPLEDRADSVIYGFDVSYGREIAAIKGRLELRGEFVRVDTDDVDFGGLLDTFRFHNSRDGWYVQAAYRPTQVEGRIFDRVKIKNLEFVLRYDQVLEPGPGRLGIDRDQLTLGIDYWILPSVVLKAAYVFDDAHGADDADGFFLEVGAGF